MGSREHAAHPPTLWPRERQGPSLRAQRAPCSGPPSLSLMHRRAFPSSACLHGCFHCLDAFPCFSQGGQFCLSSASPPHLGLFCPQPRTTDPKQHSPRPPPPQHPLSSPAAGLPESCLPACSLTHLPVAGLPAWRKAVSGQGPGPWSALSLAQHPGGSQDSLKTSVCSAFTHDRRICQLLG